MSNFVKFVVAVIVALNLSAAKAQDPVVDAAIQAARQDLAEVNRKEMEAKASLEKAKTDAMTATSQFNLAKGSLRAAKNNLEKLKDDLSYFVGGYSTPTKLQAAEAELDAAHNEVKEVVDLKNPKDFEIDKVRRLNEAIANVKAIARRIGHLRAKIQRENAERLAEPYPPTETQILQEQIDAAAKVAEDAQKELNLKEDAKNAAETRALDLEAKVKDLGLERDRLLQALGLQSLNDIRKTIEAIDMKVARIDGNIIDLKTAMKESKDALASQFGTEAAKVLIKLTEIEVATKAQADAVSKILTKAVEDLKNAANSQAQQQILEAIDTKIGKAIEILQNQKDPVVIQQEMIAQVWHCGRWVQVTVRPKK